MLGIVPSCNPVQYERKLIMETWENGEKPNFGPDFGRFSPNLGLQKFSQGFYLCWMLELSQALFVCNFRKNYDQNSRKLQTSSFWAWFMPVGPKFGLPSCKIPAKTNKPIFTKFSDGRTERWTDRWTRVIS